MNEVAFIRTQQARQTPFDNSTNGFIATNVQDAIEEIINSPVGKLSNSPVFINNGATKDKWLALDGSFSSSEKIPCVMLYDCYLSGITYSNDSDGSDSDLQVFKNGILIGNIVYTFPIRNKKTAWKNNIGTAVQLNAGDRISAYFSSIPGGVTPNSVFVDFHFIIRNNNSGEGGTIS